MTGCIVVVVGALTTGICMAHEIGHYLGLPHIAGLDAEDYEGIPEELIPDELKLNLMFANNVGLSREINAEQAAMMKTHCSVRPGC